MKKNKLMILVSLFLLLILFGIACIDLVGTFMYSDIPFILAILLYLIFIKIQRVHSNMTFGVTLFFLIWMALSYIPTGAGIVTERLGEWFYVFLVIGLAQLTGENWKRV